MMVKRDVEAEMSVLTNSNHWMDLGDTGESLTDVLTGKFFLFGEDATGNLPRLLLPTSSEEHTTRGKIEHWITFEKIEQDAQELSPPKQQN